MAGTAKRRRLTYKQAVPDASGEQRHAFRKPSDDRGILQGDIAHLPDTGQNAFHSIVLYACSTLRVWRRLVRVCRAWSAGCTQFSEDILRGQLFAYPLRFVRHLSTYCGDERTYTYNLKLGGTIVKSGTWKHGEQVGPVFWNGWSVIHRTREVCRFPEVFQFQFFPTSTIDGSQGYCFAYDSTQRFAIMCHGSERQSEGFGGDWFHFPMADGTERIFKGAWSSSAEAFNRIVAPATELRLHDVDCGIPFNMFYITDKFLQHLRRTRAELWPPGADNNRVCWDLTVQGRSKRSL